MAGAIRVDKIITSGTFSLDGGTWDVDNNVWLVGDDEEVIVIDAAHESAAIMAGVAGRRVLAVVCTHGHDDHIGVAVELRDATTAPIWLHPADRMLWDVVHPGVAPDGELADGQTIVVGGVELEVVPTPGHSPGSTCLYAPSLGVVFAGDTLFAGGPGATGRSYSDFATIVSSIRDRLLTLPLDTVVHTGHGEDTAIGTEAPHLDEWIARGH